MHGIAYACMCSVVYMSKINAVLKMRTNRVEVHAYKIENMRARRSYRTKTTRRSTPNISRRCPVRRQLDIQMVDKYACGDY